MADRIVTFGAEWDGAQLDRGTDKSASGLDRLNSAAKIGLAVFVALGTAAAVAGAKLFQMGANALETRSKFETVFGAATAGVDQFAASFSQMAGLTREAAEATVATTGQIAQGMGFATEASALFAIEVTRLAGDLGSFNNLPTAEVALAINSALTGEREQLKRLGIVIREVDVQQRALNDTGKTNAAQLTQQEKATATLALITERAGVAVGDLERTQDSAQNTMRRVVAAWGDFNNKLGEFLAKNEFVTDFLARIATMLQDITTVLSGSGDHIKEAFEIFGSLAGNAFAFAFGEAAKAALERIDSLIGPALGSVLFDTDQARSNAERDLVRLTELADEVERIQRLANNGPVVLPTINIPLVAGGAADPSVIGSIRPFDPSLPPDLVDKFAGTGAGKDTKAPLQSVIESNDKFKESLREIEVLNKEVTNDFGREWERASMTAESAFTDFFSDALRGNLESFGDFVNSIVDLWFDMVARITARNLFEDVITPLIGGAAGGGLKAGGNNDLVKLVPTASASAVAPISISAPISLNVGFVDGASGQEWLQNQGAGVIQGIVVDAIQDAPGFGRALRSA